MKLKDLIITVFFKILNFYILSAYILCLVSTFDTIHFAVFCNVILYNFIDKLKKKVFS
jgi:hypothetical protein